MNKTAIEWCDYTINPVKGLCPMACDYCYARRMYKRFKWNPEITWDEKCLLDLRKIKEPSRIFVGSTMELFGKWVNKEAMEYILSFPPDYPEHTFIFLTKQPQNLIKWSPFPDNCWVGISTTSFEQFGLGLMYLQNIKATVKFLSFEPLLSQITDHHSQYNSKMMARDFEFTGISWVIIGAQTKPTVYPRIEWVQEVVESADKAGIPVFLKDNLKPLFGGYPIPKENMWAYRFEKGRFNLRQEMPHD